MADSVRENLQKHGSELKDNVKQMMNLTFTLLSYTQKKKTSSISFVLRNMQKVKTAMTHLRHVDFDGLLPDKNLKNNELIKIYSDVVKNISALEACLTNIASENRDLTSNEKLLKRNLDCLKLASSSLRHFDFDLGFVGKDWNELEDRGTNGQKPFIQK
jgi:hypothetical protein